MGIKMVKTVKQLPPLSSEARAVPNSSQSDLNLPGLSAG